MSEANPQEFTFGAFVLNLKRGTLQRAGEDIDLRPQTFEVFSILVSRSGKLVRKDELINAVWRDAQVTNDSLTQCIVEIRRAIGDHSRTIIRTVPKRGFIFDPPESIQTDSSGNQSAPPEIPNRKVHKPWPALATVAVIVIAAFVALPSNDREDSNVIVGSLQPTMSPNSIAVLPFVDMSKAQDQKYLGDGIAEEILSRLTQYPDLVVIARTSSFLFRDGQTDISEVGRSLSSAHVLEGSIRRSGNQLRITAQLVETRGGTHVWSQSFDRELSVENLLDIQSEVAASVAESIASGATLAGQQPDPVRKAANAQAYDLYLEGMFYFHQIRAAERIDYENDVFETAIERFEAALNYDPDWAPPHVGIARTMQFRAGLFESNENDAAYEWYRISKEHLLEAIRLDPDYSLAYSSLGYVLLQLDFNFQAAEAAYAKARALGGYLPWGYAIFLAKSGRFDEAIDEYRLAIERDPLSAGPRHQLASVYRCTDRYTDSIAELEIILRLVPARNDLYLPLTYLYLKTGDLQKGRELFEQYGEQQTTSIEYGSIYVLLGMVDKAYEVLEQAEAAERWQVNDVVNTALILGEEERALNYMEAAASDDPRRLMHVLCVDGIESLADKPRFQQVLSKAGFSEQPF